MVTTALRDRMRNILPTRNYSPRTPKRRSRTPADMVRISGAWSMRGVMDESGRGDARDPGAPTPLTALVSRRI